MFALPMETAAHKRHPKLAPPELDYTNEGMVAWRTRIIASNQVNTYFYHEATFDDSFDVINWVRVYKNPKVTPTSELGAPAASYQNIRQWDIPGVVTGNSWLRPSLHWEENVSGWDALGDDEVWVNFNTETGDGSLLEDPEKPGESGLVTATENTTVKPGDRVAIAVKFTSWGGSAQPDMAIGPLVDITYQWHKDENEYRLDDQGHRIQIPGREAGT